MQKEDKSWLWHSFPKLSITTVLIEQYLSLNENATES